LLAPIAVTVVAILSAALGVWLESLRALSRKMVPFGGGILMGVALFWVLPEMAEFLHWESALAWIAAGCALLWAIDRYVHPVCPACSHSHDHDHCSTQLHGFAPPLLVAVALHAALDGWSVATANGSATLATPLVLAIAIHKIPEGLALGVIVRAALDLRGSALAWCSLAEIATLAGALLESVLAPHLSPYTLHAFLALVGGSFLYLGGHAVHGEWRRGGLSGAFVPALTGFAGPSLMRLFRILD
jgi:zinc transporter ZupT